MSSKVIAADRLGYAIGRRAILHDLSFAIERGERVVIIGRNGAGKSTLLRLASGMRRPTSGRLSVLGCALDEPVSRLALRTVRAGIGQVLQGTHLVARLTAIENVLLGGLARADGLAEIMSWARLFPPHERSRARDALSAVGMQRLADQRADRLSGGERQRVAIARSLHQGADVMFADEPTASLDPEASAQVVELLARLASERNLTLVAVVHDLRLVRPLGDRVLALRGGRLALSAPVAMASDDMLRDVFREIEGAGASPHSTPQPSVAR
ncbi:MAG: ATP-binding cassette domain-containing protein [Burkholderiales bacterium]